MKSHLQKIIASLFILFLSTTIIHAKDSAIIVFDGSGSMWGQIGGKTKIEIARDVMGTLVDDWDKEVELGLIAYGHREKGKCSDIEVLQPVSTIDSDKILGMINKIKPKGKTPISESLRMAADTLRYTEDNATVILVSDGEETCNADPCAVSKELEEQGINFTAHVIGFDIKGNQKAKDQLKCIADNTGGKFFEAEDAASLKDSLNQVKETVAIKVNTVKVKTNIGNLKIINTKDFVTAHDQESDEKKANIPRANEIVKLNAGKYKLEFDNFNVNDIEIIAGKTTIIDASKLSGWITLKNTKDFVTVHNQSDGKKRANIPRANEAVQLGIGTYKIEFDNFTLEDIEILAGETKVIDASQLSGKLMLKNTKDFVTAHDQKSGEKKANISRANEAVQLAVGTYKLNFDNFTIDDIEIVAGETKVIDVSQLSGKLTLKNTKDFVTVHDQESGTKQGNIPRTNKAVQLAIGKYQLKFKNFTLDDIEVIAGESKVIDAALYSGWIMVKNTKQFMNVFDQETNEKQGNIPRSNLDVQFPPGSYRIKGTSFEIKDIVVEAGQRTVLDIE